MSKVITAIAGLIKFTNNYDPANPEFSPLSLLGWPIKADDVFNTGLSAVGDPHADENPANTGKVLLTDPHAWLPKHIAAIRLYKSNEYVYLNPGDTLYLQTQTGAEMLYYTNFGDDMLTVEVSPAVGVTISGDSTVAASADITLTATTVPEGAEISWSSSDEEKATVVAGTDAGTGVVTGVASGSATITATITVNGTSYKADHEVTVTA